MSDLRHFVGLLGGGLGLSVGARAQPTFPDSSVPVRASNVSVEAWTTSCVAALHRGRENILRLVSGANELACHCGGEFRTWPELHVQHIWYGEGGSLWIGSAQGLVRVDDTSFTRVASRQELPHPAIIDVYRDSLVRMWVAAPAGLAQVGNGAPVVYGTEEGLPSAGGLTIYEDASSRLTVGTKAVLARLAGTRFGRCHVFPASIELPTTKGHSDFFEQGGIPTAGMLIFPRERGTFPDESGMIRGRSEWEAGG